MNAALQAIYAQIVNFAIAALAVGVVLVLIAALEGPTETDVYADSKLDLNDAITSAQAAGKEQP